MTRIIFSTTYNEPALLRMAAAAGEAGMLEAFISAEVPGDSLVRDLDRIPVVGRRGAEALRRLSANVPSDPAVRSRLFAAALLRLILWRIRFRGHAVDRVVTTPFDWTVARDLNGHSGSLFLGMPYSSEMSLKRASAKGMVTVLFNVNSDMHAENQAIKREARVAGIKARSLWPRSIVDKVDREMAEADFVLVLSDVVRERLLKSGVPDSKIVVIPNGVDTKTFRPGNNHAGADKLNLLYVGVISLRKGIHYLNDAARLAQPYIEKCSVIGGVVDKELIGRTPYLQYEGMKSHSGVATALQAADVFVFPSLFEGMARAVLEAMASGLPVITTREAGYEGVIRSGENGFLVPARDPAAIAEVIRYLAQHPFELCRIGQEARKTAEEYTWDRLGQTFVQWADALS